MKKILLIAGTRPNFIKLAPLYHRIKSEANNIQPFICHTGQHFDFNMSDVFWQNLELPVPDYQLNIKGNGVSDTIGKTIIGINEVIIKYSFDLMIVFGDVNATAAGAIVGAQSQIPVMHVEAGLRSFDRTMPEEINRIITDHISDHLMVSEASGIQNLQKEGISDKAIFIGNIMIESLLLYEKKWKNVLLSKDIEKIYHTRPIITTFHRPENVDNSKSLERIVEIILSFAEERNVIFPVHPRTMQKLRLTNLLHKLQNTSNLLLTEPLSYFEFLKLMSNANLVVTDSGGVQEETSFLNIPCITFRNNTERPVTVELGTNLMMSIWEDNFFQQIMGHIKFINSRNKISIPLWDNEVSERILQYINTLFSNNSISV